MSLQIRTRINVYEDFIKKYDEQQKSFYQRVFYADGSLGELDNLRSYYREILKYSIKLNPLNYEIMFIGNESFNYPINEAFDIALDEISIFLSEHDLNITLVVEHHDSWSFISPICGNLRNLIEPVRTKTSNRSIFVKGDCCSSSIGLDMDLLPYQYDEKNTEVSALDELVENAQKNLNFQDTLQQMISERNLSNNYVYSRALIDRRFFSKIISQKNYVPKKQTVMALGLALELEMQDFEKLLESAGYAFMPSSVFDIVIKYCVENKIYNIIQINFILHDYGINTFSRM